MGLIDLHVHSVRSDGTMTPRELVDYAVEKGVTAMALTDHDTIDGIDEIMEYAKGKPVEIIPGIEYSTEYKGRDVHILGLFIDHKAPVFTKYLAGFKQSRIDRNKKLCANLREDGIDISYEALQEMFAGAVVTRAHYAHFMLDKGYVKSISEAFDRYLGDDTKYFVHREKVTPEDVIRITLEAGGIPVLAHPALYKLGRVQLEELVCRLKSAGLMGIECIYSTYTPSDERQMKELAKKYNLLLSGGTDFHGTNKKGIDIGVGYGKLCVPESFLAKMKKSLDTKILFTDLDETLLKTDKTISATTREKLLEMMAAGHYFVLASGRDIESIRTVLETLDIQEPGSKGMVYITASNGAVLYDCENSAVIERYDVPMAAAQAVFDSAVARGVHIQTYADGYMVVSADDKETSFYTRAIKLPYVVGTRLDKELVHAPAKLLAIDLDDRSRLEGLRKEIEASEFGSEITCAFSNQYFLEFYNEKAGKGNALINMCRALNVHIKNSVAAGDEENDISMLEAAAVGVCMVNGSEAVKSHAGYITENDNNHDGIVEIIDRFILNQQQKNIY